MVAIAILGLSLTVILSAQAGLYSSGAYARNISQATGLARCKMAEVEEYLLKFGYPLDTQTDEGPCCDDDTRTPMRCSWSIETVKLPEPTSMETLLGEGKFDSSFGPLGALGALGQNPSLLSQESGAGGISTLADVLSASTGGQPMGSSALAPLVMGMVYPQLKPMLEASIRKVTVKVKWKEGKREREFEIVQYVTNPMQGGLLPDSALLDSSTGTGSGSPGSGTGNMTPAGGTGPSGGFGIPKGFQYPSGGALK